MKLHWTSRALKDRRSIYDFVETSNPVAAINLDKKFVEAAQLLAAHPALGRIGQAIATRELVVHRHYLLIYDLMNGSVRVLRVIHTSRRWPPSP